MRPSALAIVAVRNEAVHMHRLLRHLIADGLDVAVIDNGSTDGSREIAESYLGAGVVHIGDLPWDGEFALAQQLQAKADIAEQSPHDWIVHLDADEWLQNPDPNQTLLDGMAAAEAAGANYLNFNEFVFVALAGEDFFSEDYHTKMRRYYFFQPYYPRAMRAWKNHVGICNQSHGGHMLEGPIKKFDTDFIIRHYITLSEAHAARKYVGRKFPEEEIRRGWHHNRLDLKESQLSVTANHALKYLATADTRIFDLSAPVKKHFWEW